MISAVKVAKFTMQYTEVDKGRTEHSRAQLLEAWLALTSV